MDEYLINEIIRACKLIEKFNNEQALTLEELEFLLPVFQAYNYETALTDNRFDNSKFRQLYLIYSFDLKFKSVFYKYNKNKKVSHYLNLKEIKEVNEKEYNFEFHNQLENLLIKNKFLIQVSESEVQKDKLSLEKYANEWADICLDLRHSDDRLKTIAKETRDTLKMRSIEDYLNKSLSESERIDVFKGLLKSRFVHLESIKIIESIDSKKENRIFTLNGISFEINYYSYVHIINRHYAEIISSKNTINSKSFHNTKIEPCKIHFFINELVTLIKDIGIESQIKVTKNQPLLIKFYEHNYALFINEYKHDKSKLILETFFIIESDNSSASRLIKKIKIAEIFKLNNNLSIYI